MQGATDGRAVYRAGAAVLRRDVGLVEALRTVVGGDMTVLYVLGGLLAVGLMAYLLVALLKPELF